MNSILLGILFLLLIWLNGTKGISLFLSIILNFVILLTSFILITLGLNPVIIALIISIILSKLIINRTTEDEMKRSAAWKASIITFFVVGFIASIITIISRNYGFGYDSLEEINMYSYNINISYLKIEIAVILFGIVGAVVDASISITTAMKEIVSNNKKMKEKELLISGMHIGKDIIGTTINTLLFVFMGESITLILYFHLVHYELLDLINNKTLLIELSKIIFSMIGSIIVIPLTSYISAKLYTKEER